MFSKAKTKSSDDAPQSSAAPEPASSNAVAPAPTNKRSSAMKSAGVPSIISADVVVSGNINAAGEVQLDGELQGDIKAARLIVGEKATVRGEIICEGVTVRGRVEGGIRAKQVTLAATAHIEGDIVHSALSVESGAYFEGNCRHSDDPLSEAAAADFRKTRPVAPAPRPSETKETANAQALRQAAANSGEAPSFLSQSRSPLR